MENLADCINYHAVVSPDKTALIFQDRSYTYFQLKQQFERLAHILAKQRLGKNQSVGLLIPNSDSAVISLFAVFHLGACAVGFNPLLHPKEVVNFAKDSDISGLFLTKRQYDHYLSKSLYLQIPTLRKIVVFPESFFSADEIQIFDVDSPDLDSAQSIPNQNKLSGEDNALILYTSGSTGAAKGVILTHKNLLDNSKAAVSLMHIESNDYALMTLPMCHVYALTRQLFPHFLQGAMVQLVSSSAQAELINYKIDSQKITTFSGVPYHFASMLARGAGTKYPMKTLRIATSASMSMDSELRQALVQALPHTNFSCQYGLTEASGFVTALPSDLFTKKVDSVGRSIPGMEIKIEVSSFPMPIDSGIGATGELLVKGSGIMKGYYSKVVETSAVIDDDGWLKTGDLAHIDQDGDVTIICRKKNLIKRAGETIIPEEIEAVIAQHETVAEVCVFSVPDRDLGESVRAAVVLHHKVFCKEEILTLCKENLARFKVPEDIFFVNSFPRTYNRKIDRKAIIENYLKSLI